MTLPRIEPTPVTGGDAVRHPSPGSLSLALQIDGASREQHDTLLHTYAEMHAEQDSPAMWGFLRALFDNLPSGYIYSRMAALTLSSPTGDGHMRDVLAKRGEAAWA